MRLRVFLKRSAFTLIELLIVIGVVAILATVTLLVLNPAEMLKQGRDAKRLSEITSINDALNLAVAQSPNISLGTPKILYISLPDESDTCDNHLADLPSLPIATGWKYRCATAVDLRKSDGTGWLPINFSGLPSSPLSNLPVDPLNTAAGGMYYAYTPGGSWELGANMESSKYGEGGERDVTSGDGGTRSTMYERGTNLTLLPFDEAKVDLSCFASDTGTLINFYKNYTALTLPGNGSVKVVGLMFWQANDTLATNEVVKVAFYQNTFGNSYTILTSSTISGTGSVGWIYGYLTDPVDVVLGQKYVFGFHGNFNPAEASVNCGGYPPAESTYDAGVGSLANPLIFSPNTSSKMGFFGVVYVRD